jgi:hypothetical protein
MCVCVTLQTVGASTPVAHPDQSIRLGPSSDQSCIARNLFRCLGAVNGLGLADKDEIVTAVEHWSCVGLARTIYIYGVYTVFLVMCRVGQNHIYTVYIRYFWQENHQIYGHVR